jgi:pyrroloquinoline quinone (PQQ) biosynthesis protein C
MQVRVYRRIERNYFYFEGVSAKRAIELATERCAALCIEDVDYFEAIDDTYEYDAPGVLVADYMGRPCVTVNLEQVR